MDFYRDIQDKGYDCGLKRSGNLILGCNDEEAQYLLDEHNTLISNGYKSEFLSSVEAVIAQEAALKGGSAIAALYTENSGYVDPLQATHAIKEAAMDSGLYVYEYSRVVNIERLPGDIMKPQFRQFWRVTTSDGTFIDAKHVVVAAGVWCPVLLFPLGIQVPIFPVKGTMWESNLPGIGELLKHTIYVAESALAWKNKNKIINNSNELVIEQDTSDSPMYCTHDATGELKIRHCYGRPREDGSVVFGGSRLPMRLGDLRDEVDKNSIETVFEHVSELLPVIKTVGRSGGCWSGHMPFSRDGAPLVGHLDVFGPELEGLWISGGFGPDGMMMGPGAAEYLSGNIIKHILSKQEVSTCNSSIDGGDTFQVGDQTNVSTNNDNISIRPNDEVRRPKQSNAYHDDAVSTMVTLPIEDNVAIIAAYLNPAREKGVNYLGYYGECGGK